MKKQVFLLSLLATLLGSSCTSEYHYAKQFLRKHRWHTKAATEQIYLHLPNEVYLTQTERAADSAGLIGRLNDSVFLAQFGESLVATLSRLGAPVVRVDDEALLPPPSRDCLILDVAALEAEEWTERVQSGFTTRMGAHYRYDLDVRHFAANGWFQLNYDTVYFFLSQEVSEQEHFNAMVECIERGRARMKVSRKALSVNDCYTTARSLGALTAVLYIEKVLCEYVATRKGRNEWYMIFNPDQRDINVKVPFEVGLENSFEIVE